MEGGVEDRRSKPSKEWNASTLELRNFGVQGNYHQCRYPQVGTTERWRATKGHKGREKAEQSQNVRGLGE